jgi:hypothetical protein
MDLYPQGILILAYGHLVLNLNQFNNSPLSHIVSMSVPDVKFRLR